MTDVRLSWNNETQTVDLVMAGPDLATDDGLETAVIMSLGTDAPAGSDDKIPDGSDDGRGWWGDAFHDAAGDVDGSQYWLLSREKLTSEALLKARNYAEKALAWLVTDLVASKVTVTVELWGDEGAIAVIQILKPDGNLAGKYTFIWKAMA
ncbi:phage protein GP46 family protein [Asticcacaulis biprosthecium C19]|uniref:Phage protein GP46 family protein n=1 Tax=Asticcacaulis biprosthecium C19 TaxID=715226 RepID=F4QG86_9CAUL|nr:phage GP46 family protein [Asticcacaulis biprosthecium]EGF92414.1 phage protein GP46 family protein [Asticcacaulis biprosthecium C19]